VQEKKNNFGKQIVGIAFALILLWAAFAGSNPQQLWRYIQNIQAIYLLPIAAIALFGHWLRAWRWRILLKPFKKVSLFNTFTALMVGYAVNIIIPRGGEIARIVSLARSEQLPWAGILPTMLIDRILDIAALAILLAVSLLYLPESLAGNLTWLKPAGVVMVLVTLIGLIGLPYLGKLLEYIFGLDVVKKKAPAKFVELASKLSTEFEQGTRCLKNPLAYPEIAILSVVIWFTYWAGFYLMLMAFGLTTQVNMLNAFLSFTIGSVGVLVPTPGSVGSYHFLVSQALVILSNVDKDQALAFVSLLHLFTFMLVPPLTAFVCVTIASMQKSKN
jgi:glycosyltransferase 2 family protein